MFDCKFDEESGVLTIDDGVVELDKHMLEGIDINQIRKVVMSNSVERVKAHALEKCANLEEIVFSENLETIEEDNFWGCLKLKEVKFPSSLKSILARSFEGCENLEKVVLNEGLELIGHNVFENCESLTAIDFPDSLLSIQDRAFYNAKIENAVLPKNLKEFGVFVFKDSLKNIKVDAENENFKVIDDIFLVQLDEEINGMHGKTLKLCTGREMDRIVVPSGISFIEGHVFMRFAASEIVLPEGIQTIGKTTFQSCKNLKTMVLPDSLISIGDWSFHSSGIEELHIGKGLNYLARTAFENCDNIKKITVSPENSKFKTDKENTALYDNEYVLYKSVNGKFPDANIEQICFGCFTNLDLEEIVISDSVKDIHLRAFKNCQNLKKVTFGKNVKYCAGIFENCPNINELAVSGENENLFTYDNKAIFAKLGENQGVELVIGTKDTTLPSNCVKIGHSAFAHNEGISKVKSLSSVKNLKEIETNAQKDTDKTIYIPDSVKVIDYDAFVDCPNLDEIDLKNSNVELINNEAFYICENLRKVHLPNNVTVGRMAFGTKYGNSKIEDVSIPFNMRRCDARGNRRLFINEDTGFDKYVLRIQDKEIEIKPPVRSFVNNSFLVTDSEVVFLDQNNEVVVEKVGFFEKAKKTFNKLERLKMSDWYKVYFWMQKHAGEVPPYYVVESMCPSEIENFYKYRKDWADLAKKFKHENTEELKAFFKCCCALGVFHGQKALIEKAILPNLTAQDIVYMFDDCNTYKTPFNKEFSDLFFKFFIKKDEKGVNLKDSEGNFIVEGRDYLSIRDYVSGEVSLVADFHNDFNRLLEEHSNKQIKGGTGGYSKLRVEDIVKTYASKIKYSEEVVDEEIEKFNERVKDIKDQDGNVIYDQSVFEQFVDVVNLRESQEHMVMLAEAFALGLINWEKEENKDKRLVCKKDNENNKITYELLKKTDGYGAIIGILTDCCQAVENTGGSCVEYGMKMANSGFVAFKHNNRLIGQAWVWYDKDAKQVTLDNIEAPNIYLNEIINNKELELEMVDCLTRLGKAFLEEMGDKVEKVTIGIGNNSVSEILNKYFTKVPSKEMKTLSDYEQSVNLKFGPNGEDYAYSDAVEGKGGQVVIADRRQKLEEDLMQNLNYGRNF